MNLWWGENATKLRVFENDVLIATVPLVYSGLSAQSAAVPVSGKTNGAYVYTGELINSQGVTATKPVTVTVTQANPSKPSLSHDNRDGDGTYTVTADLWWGTNATSYRFLSDGVVVGEGALTSASPGAQRAQLTVTDAPKGSHEYVVEFRNAAGVTTSSPITVTVTK
jgi:hypothetical protein